MEATTSQKPSGGEGPKGSSGLAKFRFNYGAEPLHLLAVLTTLALAGYGLLRIFENPGTGTVLLWLGAAILAHDFLAMPIYSVLIRISRGASDAVWGIASPQFGRIALNHLRIPAGFSLILLLVSLPLIFEFAPDAYLVTTGVTVDGYLSNWLGITGVLFAISGVWLALRIRRNSGSGPAAATGPRETTPDPPPRVLRVLSKVVLAVGLLVVAWVAAALVVGLLSNPPF